METIADWLTGLPSWEAASEVLRLDLLEELLLATLLGGVVGWERETSGKPAGFRSRATLTRVRDYVGS